MDLPPGNPYSLHQGGKEYGARLQALLALQDPSRSNLQVERSF